MNNQKNNSLPSSAIPPLTIVAKLQGGDVDGACMDWIERFGTKIDLCYGRYIEKPNRENISAAIRATLNTTALAEIHPHLRARLVAIAAASNRSVDSIFAAWESYSWQAEAEDRPVSIDGFIMASASAFDVPIASLRERGFLAACLLCAPMINT